MQKNPITIENQTQESKPKKQKKNKHPTACIDKTRSPFSCGICGSDNLVYSGVCGCEECDNEKYFVVATDWGWWSYRDRDGYYDSNWKCDHKEYYDRVDKKMKPRYRIVIEACADCGAMKSSICPNCKRRLWLDKFGLKKHCQWCGYRS